MEFEKIKIQSIFFDKFEETFSKIFIEGLKSIDPKTEVDEEKMSKAMKEAYDIYEDQTTTFYLKSHKFRIEDFIDSTNKNQLKIIEKNKDSFTNYILYINASVIIYKKILDKMKSTEFNLSNNTKLYISLYGMIIRRSQQIAELLISGFVDGAMILWRSLYENAVILLTLATQNNTDLADRFIEHSLRNSLRKVNNYKLNFEELKFKPLPDDVFKDLTIEKERIIKKYGKDFLKRDFGWADIIFNKKSTFRDLEDELSMQRFRPYYTICSEQIHSNFNGFERFRDKEKLILENLVSQEFEPSSFIDPMQFSTAVLDEVNDFVLWEFSTEHEKNANILFMGKIFRKLMNTFKNSGS